MLLLMLVINLLALSLTYFKHSLTATIYPRLAFLSCIYISYFCLNSLVIPCLTPEIEIFNSFYLISTTNLMLISFLFLIGGLILQSFPTLITSLSIFKNIHSFSFVNRVFLTDKSLLLYHLIGNPLSSLYSLICLFSLLGGSLLIISNDLLSMYLSIELQSFSLYILATLYRNSEKATSAGLKYFLLGGLSSCLILLGCSFIYIYTGLTDFQSIYSLLESSSGLVSTLENPSIPMWNTGLIGLTLGFIILLIGYFFKISAAPFHHWAPDVYSDSPTIITVWLTVMAKISILVFLMQFSTYFASYINYYSLSSISFLNLDDYIEKGAITNIYLDSEVTINYLKDKKNLDSLYNLGIYLTTNMQTMFNLPSIKDVLLISSFLSLLIGSIVGLSQTKLKRLLAYSTITHIGFLLLCLSIDTQSSNASFLFYLIQYTLTNLTIFLCILALDTKLVIPYNNYILSLLLSGKHNIVQTFISNPLFLSFYSLSARLSASKKKEKEGGSNEIVTVKQKDKALISLNNHNLDKGNDLNNLINLNYSIPPISIKSNPLINKTIIDKDKEITTINDLKGQYSNNQMLSISIGICLFSMAGIPPLIGFFGKQSVLFSAISNDYYFISLIAILSSVISASYYLKLIKVLLSDNLENSTVVSKTPFINHNESNTIFFPLNKKTKISNANLLTNNDVYNSYNSDKKEKGSSNMHNLIDKYKYFSLISWIKTLKNTLFIPSFSSSYLEYKNENSLGNGNLNLNLNSLPLSISEKKEDFKNSSINLLYSKPLTNNHSLIISILSVYLFYFFLKPSLLLNSTVLLSLTLFFT